MSTYMHTANMPSFSKIHQKLQFLLIKEKHRDAFVQWRYGRLPFGPTYFELYNNETDENLKNTFKIMNFK